MTRRNLFIIGVLVILLVCGFAVVSTLQSAGEAARKAAATPTAAPVQSRVTAKASLVPARYAKLSFATTGIVAQVMVNQGDKVKAGDVLGMLDTGDLKLQVQNAQDSLDIAAATLAQAKGGGTPDEIAAAEANLRNAAAQLDRAKNGPSKADLEILKANLAKADAALQNAQAAYDRAGGASNPMIGMLPQSLQLQQAYQDYAVARANYELKTQVDAATLASAEAAFLNAQAALDLKKNGARAADLAVHEARLRQAKTALAQAQASLAKATLAAPFDGTVTAVSLRQGEMITAGTPALTIADLSQMQVETVDLDEWGAARIEVGQPVKVLVNAFEGKTLTGRVSSVASESVTLSTGDIAYIVTIALDQQDPGVRWGMTVKVEFGN